MSAGGSAPGRREVAHRLFAAEFDDADFSYSESDEERAPNYVVTPTGARVNRLFVSGVLTETEPVNEEMLRARVVDPTGAFVTYAGQYQPEALAFLERVDPPAFLAVTGKARTFQPEDSNRVYTSIRPESISEVDSETRDRWVVQTAERTIERVETMAAAIDSELSGDALSEALEADGVEPSLAAGIPLALDHYGTTPDYLAALREVAEEALAMVAGDVDEVSSLAVAPNEGAGDAGSLATRELPAVAAGTGDTSTESDAGFEPPSEGTVASTADDEAVASTTTEVDDDAAATASESAPEPDETPATADASAAEPSADAESTPEPDEESSDSGSGAAEPEPTPEPESDTAGSEPTADSADADVPSTDSGAAETDDDIGDFEPDEEFDPDDEVLTDEEREEAAELGGFSTGNEVEDPGEVDVETPESTVDAEPETTEAEPEPAADDEAAAGEDDDAAAEADVDAADDEADDTPTEANDDAASDVPLDEAVMTAMKELDDGDGAPHDDIVDRVVDSTGANPDDVEQAIQDALMSGQCYEPDDGVFKPI